MLTKNGLRRVSFIDTSKAPKDEVGTGKPLQDSQQLTAFSLNADRRLKATSLLEMSERKGLPSIGGALSNAANAAGAAAGAAANVASAVAGSTIANVHCPEGMP